jgi:N-acetylmuramoyl-L-alanine amidase
VREGEALRRLFASLEGAGIGIDAAHGPGDPGARGPGGLTEAEATYWMAEALMAELIARGASPLLLRSRDDNPREDDRVRRANRLGPDILIILHLNAHEDPAAEGASTYYYGREGWVSQAGQRLAELIQHELTGQLGLKDGRTHPKSLPLLRETRMPAVQVEPCFISNPVEEAALRDEAFRRRLAAAITDAIAGFFRVGEAGDGRSPVFQHVASDAAGQSPPHAGEPATS